MKLYKVMLVFALSLILPLAGVGAQDDPPVVAARDAAIARLREELGYRAGLDAYTYEETQWSDTSLDCPTEGETYSQVVTPGFRFEMTVNGVSYELHTSLDAKIVRFCGATNLDPVSLIRHNADTFSIPYPSQWRITPGETETLFSTGETCADAGMRVMKVGPAGGQSAAALLDAYRLEREGASYVGDRISVTNVEQLVNQSELYQTICDGTTRQNRVTFMISKSGDAWRIVQWAAIEDFQRYADPFLNILSGFKVVGDAPPPDSGESDAGGEDAGTGAEGSAGQPQEIVTFLTALVTAVQGGDYEGMGGMMADTFNIMFPDPETEVRALSAADAVVQIRDQYASGGPITVKPDFSLYRFVLPNYAVTLDTYAANLYSEGWGAAATDTAILHIARSATGELAWSGMTYISYGLESLVFYNSRLPIGWDVVADFGYGLRLGIPANWQAQNYQDTGAQLIDLVVAAQPNPPAIFVRRVAQQADTAITELLANNADLGLGEKVSESPLNSDSGVEGTLATFKDSAGNDVLVATFPKGQSLSDGINYAGIALILNRTEYEAEFLAVARSVALGPSSSGGRTFELSEVEAATPEPETGDMGAETGEASETGSTGAPADIGEFQDQLLTAVYNENAEGIRQLMGETFTVMGYQSESMTYAPDEAVDILVNQLLGSSTRVAFKFDTDAADVIGEDPAQYAPGLSRAIFSTGWGENGQGEAILFVSVDDAGLPYWYGILYAINGFN